MISRSDLKKISSAGALVAAVKRGDVPPRYELDTAARELRHLLAKKKHQMSPETRRQVVILINDLERAAMGSAAERLPNPTNLQPFLVVGGLAVGFGVLLYMVKAMASPKTTWKRLSQPVIFAKGRKYRISVDKGISVPKTEALSELQTVGADAQIWTRDQLPSDWPSDDSHRASSTALFGQFTYGIDKQIGGDVGENMFVWEQVS